MERDVVKFIGCVLTKVYGLMVRYLDKDNISLGYSLEVVTSRRPRRDGVPLARRGRPYEILRVSPYR